MLIHFNPEDYETVVEHRTCEYHKKHPEHRSYAGCACSATYALRRKETKVRVPRRLRP